MKKDNSEKGFSYVDVIIAIVIMMVGILACVSALTANLIRSYETEKQIKAKQIGLSTVESIFSARDIARTTGIKSWNTIGNTDKNPDENGNPQGIIMKDWRPIRVDAGWDGVVGTVDDACDAPGICQISGRTDNTSEIVDGFQRKIVITDIEDPERPLPDNPISRRRIDVHVRYFLNNLEREQVISTIITNYAE